jgi:uncharacterized membrane-anchored protein
MVLFLLGMSGYQQYVLWTGKRAVLKTEPVDPRSLFRGDYVILNYTINTIECDRSNVYESEKYVQLEKIGDAWRATKLLDELPDRTSDGTVILHARLEEVDGGTCSLEYPSIQSYYVPEGEGGKIERFQGQGLKVEIAVSQDGYAVIQKLIFPE